MAEDYERSPSPGDFHGVFPFMKLPLELRRQVYQFMLPRQEEIYDATYDPTYAYNPKYTYDPTHDMTLDRPGRAKYPHKRLENKCMNILLANRQISNEAREMLYGLNTFTVRLFRDEIIFLEEPDDVWPDDIWTDPTSLSMPSLSYIKHWEIDIMFQEGSEHKSFEADTPQEIQSMFGHHDDRYGPPSEEEAIIMVADHLAKIEGLQSLRVKFPCLCKIGDFNKTSNDRYSRLLQDLLNHLKRLHVQGPVVFVAAQLNGLRNLHWRSVRTRDYQCQQPDCLAFVASLDEVKTFVTGKFHRKNITPPECKWLATKPRISLVDLVEVEEEDDLCVRILQLWKMVGECRKATTEGRNPPEDLQQKFNDCYEDLSRRFDAIEIDAKVDA
ncbi:MAG: hypothetical protein Q9192_004219 [Flavoplaca navasiana]